MKHTRAQKWAVLLIAVAMTLSLVGCTDFGGQKFSMEEVYALLEDFEIGNKYNLTLTVSLDGEDEVVEEVGDDLLEASTAFIRPLSLEGLISVDGKLEPGTVAKIAFACDTSGDDTNMQVRTFDGDNGFEVLKVGDSMYLSTGILVSMVESMADDSDTELSDGVQEGIAKLKKIQYIEVGSEEGNALVDMSRLTDISDTVTEAFDDIKDINDDEVTILPDFGNSIVYVLTATEETTRDTIEELELDDVLQDYELLSEWTVGKDGNTYTLIYTVGAKEANVSIKMVVNTVKAHVQAPEDSDVVSMEEAVSLLEGHSIPNNDPEDHTDPDKPTKPDDEDDGPSTDVSTIIGAIEFGAPSHWLENSDDTDIDFSGPIQDYGAWSGDIYGVFQHKQTGVAKHFKAIDGYREASKADRKQAITSYAKSIYDACADQGLEFEYTLEFDDDVEYNAYAFGSAETRHVNYDYDLWFNCDDEEITQNIKFSAAFDVDSSDVVGGLDLAALSEQIESMVGLVVSEEDLKQVIEMAVEALTHIKATNYLVEAIDYVAGDGLSVYVSDYGGSLYISISASTTIQPY